MKLIISGASGFLGNYILDYFQNSLNEVQTIGRTATSDIVCDLSKSQFEINNSINCVIHCAGKAHTTPKNEEEEELFYKVNYEGTVNLCKSLEKGDGLPKYFVFISTVAVYGKETGKGISENSPLLGDTPYAKSKIMAEEFLQSWCKDNDVVLTILRPSLIAGKNAPGNLHDMINAIRKGYFFTVNGGKALKSIVLASDIAKLIPLIMKKGGIYNVTDGVDITFRELSDLISKQLGKSKKTPNVPLMFIKPIAYVGDFISKFPLNNAKLDKITMPLSFSSKKLVDAVDWKPQVVVKNYEIY